MSRPASSARGSGSSRRLLLRIHRSSGNLEEIYVAKGLTIGRHEGNTVWLDGDPAVDPSHAKVVDENGTLWLRCVRKSGRIIVGGNEAHEVPLEAGAAFDIGETRFECAAAGPPAEAGSPRTSRFCCPYCEAEGPQPIPTGVFSCSGCGKPLIGGDALPGREEPWLLPASSEHFVAEQVVGCGGMGLVLRGTGTEGGQPVAVKFVHPYKGNGLSAAGRFAQEVRLMGQINHPNVVKLLRAGEEAGSAYLVMEWVEGRTLRDVIRASREEAKLPDFGQVLYWFIDVAKALAAVHRHGIVHRDVKPSNILLDLQDQPKLADLGLARPIQQTTGGLTTTGDAPGTWEYIAPEQFNSPESVDFRADYYSLGITFYELLTGHRPVGAWQPASQVNRTVPPVFDEILNQLLQPDPSQRCSDLPRLLEQAGGLCELVRPKWSYRYKTLCNYFEITNESLLPLTDVVVEASWRHESGQSGAFRIELDRLDAEASHRKEKPFPPHALFEVAYVEAKMRCSRGPVQLSSTVAAKTARAKERYEARKQEEKTAARRKAESGGGQNQTVGLSSLFKVIAVLAFWWCLLTTRSSPRPAVAPFNDAAAKRHQQAWAKHLGVPVEITNSIGMKLTLIPPGEFVMGSTVSAAEIHRRFPGGGVEWYKREHPPHKVRITRPYYLGTHEVSVADFQRFVTATDYKTTAEKEGNTLGVKSVIRDTLKVVGLNWRKPGFDQESTHPVTCVSWDDATAFCQWLSREEGRTYRLPTEAEWEFACRAGTDTLFFWGDDPDAGEGYLNAHFNFWDGYAATSPVGRFKPNAFGLHDMLGNVWEWCSDWYGGYTSTPVDDPTGPTKGLTSLWFFDCGASRVSRGGGFPNNARFCRSARRLDLPPAYRDNCYGFRLAISFASVRPVEQVQGSHSGLRSDHSNSPQDSAQNP